MFEFLRARRRALVLAAASAAVAVLASCSGGDADKPALFSTVVVVGASGADVGNRCEVFGDLCFPAPPYGAPSIAANGKLYTQLVAERYGAPDASSSRGGTNFAVGGARTGVIPGDTVPATYPSIQVQLEQYLQRFGYQINGQALFILDGTAFGNNIRRALELLPAIPPANQSAFVTGVVSQGAADIYSAVLRA